VVCGEALVDLVPAPGGGLRPIPGGGPFNTARALARLGMPTAYLGRLSTDGFGRLLARRLADDGVDFSRASWGEEPTTLAVAELDHDGAASYRFYVEGTSAPHLTPEMLPPDIGTDVTALHCGVRRIRPPSSAESDQADRLNPTTQFGVSDHLGEDLAAA
jgi:fructokinase